MASYAASPSVRATEFHFACRSTLAETLATAEGRELDLSSAEGLAEGDWLLVTICVPEASTCLAARVVAKEAQAREPNLGIEFAEHDWKRLLSFAAEGSGARGTPPSRQSPLSSISPPTDARILLVHEDPKVASVLRSMLGSRGFRARWVATLREALEALKAEPIDIVLADWMPDGTSEREFCAACQGISQTARRPSVVFLACPSARGDAPVAIDAGADDFVVLPFRWRELDARLLSLLKRAAS